MNLNTQRPSKVIKSSNAFNSISVHSIFYTIQGEGPFAGEPAIFIRLAGCNLQCPLCDTEYTTGAMPYTPATLADEIIGLVFPPPQLVVITGGEPFRQPISPHVRVLLDAGFRVQTETNGTLYRDDMPYGYDRLAIVCSPKTHFVNPHLLPHITALKYVGKHDNLDPLDGLPISALNHPVKGKLFRPPVDFPGTVFLQPVDEQDEHTNLLNQQAVIQSCMKYGHRLCLQLHKIIGLA